MIFFGRADTACFLFRSSLQNPNRLSLPPISLFGGSSRLVSLFFLSFPCMLACRLCLRCAFSTPGFQRRIPLLTPALNVFSCGSIECVDLPHFQLRFLLIHTTPFTLVCYR